MFYFLLNIVIVTFKLVSGQIVVLSGDDNVIQGQTASFRAEVFDKNGQLSPSEYIFEWTDNATPPHKASLVAKSPVFWNVTYDSTYAPDVYNVAVKVLSKKFLFGTAVTKFRLTKFLSGDIVLSQGGVIRKKYISNDMPVNHTIVLKNSFLEFIRKTKNFIKLFWFVDCVYYGVRSDFEFDFNYTKVDSMHYVEALLVAAYNPNLTKEYILPSVEKSGLKNLTGLKEIPKITPILPNLNSSKSNETDFDGVDEELKNWIINLNATKKFNASDSKNYCINSSVVPINPDNSYGFFRTNLVVKSPVKIFPFNGTNWLMDGEILNISLHCNGSSPYSYCVLFESELYNITGNETCSEETIIMNCSFGIHHLFEKPSDTVVVIISNAVSRVVKSIAVNIYKVKKHAQLSVIIVPVSFSLIATILIIFGVAYYVQSKHKCTIEVADFDFSNQTSNMEYKTFRERLRESISNSFLKSNDFKDDDSSWSESVPTSRKYGSMQ